MNLKMRTVIKTGITAATKKIRRSSQMEFRNSKLIILLYLVGFACGMCVCLKERKNYIISSVLFKKCVAVFPFTIFN